MGSKKEWGLVGLGKMGGNLALQALEKGMTVVGFDLKKAPDEYLRAGLIQVGRLEDPVVGSVQQHSVLREEARDRCARADGVLVDDELAELTEGYSGSDLRLVIREAVLNALLEDRKHIGQDDLLESLQRDRHDVPADGHRRDGECPVFVGDRSECRPRVLAFRDDIGTRQNAARGIGDGSR